MSRTDNHIKSRQKRQRRCSQRVFLALLLCAGLLPARAQVREYQLKAVFLFHFSQFVEWPPSAFAGPAAPFIIGIVGPDPFGTYLTETVKGETVMGHPVVVHHFSTEQEIGPCHILYFSKKDNPDMLRLLKEQSILTVGETPGFTQAGGIIQFFTEQNKIRFQINPVAAKAARLNISSKLLRLAKIVE